MTSDIASGIAECPCLLAMWEMNQTGWLDLDRAVKSPTVFRRALERGGMYQKESCMMLDVMSEAGLEREDGRGEKRLRNQR